MAAIFHGSPIPYLFLMAVISNRLSHAENLTLVMLCVIFYYIFATSTLLAERSEDNMKPAIEPTGRISVPVMKSHTNVWITGQFKYA